MRTYRPPPAPDDPNVVEGRRRAARDRESGVFPRDWPQDEREGWSADPKAHLAMLQAYWPARDESRLRAPPAWPAELAFIAIGAAWTGAVQRFGLRAMGWWPLMVAISKAQASLRSEASRLAARRHRLTHLNAPRSTVQQVVFIRSAAILGYALWRRLRGAPRVAPLPWTLEAASRIVAAIEERRSWRRAFEASRT